MNEQVFSFFQTTPDSAEWLDWKWQYKNRITRADALSEIISFDKKERREIELCLSNLKMAITPYFASLMDPTDPVCPIRQQAVPSGEELLILPTERKDPLNEEHYSPVRNIVHRYPDRVLFLVSRQCAMYCRHCTRRTRVGDEGFFLTEEETEEAIDYITSAEEVRDVLISGGDPLVMDDGRLEELLSRLRAIRHVDIIRIGTRVPSVLPMRVTPSLLAMLKKYQPIWMNTQFNHPNELTHAAIQACADIVDAGIPLGNQSVLLKNINNDTETMRELLLGLLKARVRPYYLYQCDLCEGLSHFRARVQDGIEIIRNLTGHITGLAIPQFVIDAPDGGGKIPVNPEYLLSVNDDEIVMRNFKGDIYIYPQT